MTKTVRIDLAYDGTDFFGWQIQPNKRSVQGDLAAMFERLLGRPLKPTGAGRTDAGVHALGQVAHASGLNADEIERLQRALARVAPEDMKILYVREVSPAFNARFGAIWRRYEYRLAFGRELFRRREEWQLHSDLDRAAMDEATAALTGRHDFTSFCKARSLKEDSVCHVTECRWEWRDDQAVFRVQANRFLHHMVRTMVATLLEVGTGREPPTSIRDILNARDRSAAGTMAPAKGLYLAEVGYPIELMDPGFMPAEATAEPAATRPEETP